MRRGAVAALLAAAPGPALAALAAPARASTLIATEPFASKIAAYGGYVAWSHWDATIGAFRLMVRGHGRIEAAAVAPRTVPFDVALGPDARRRVVAVYSRCATERAVWETNPPDPPSAAPVHLPGGCRLFAYDLASRRERRLSAVRLSGSTYLPSIWGGELAYVHAGSSGPTLVVQPLTAPAQLVRAGARTVRRRMAIVARALPGGDRSATGPGPVSLSLRSGRLAVVWAGGDGRGTWDTTLLLDAIPATRRAAPTQVRLDAESADRRAPGALIDATLTATSVSYGVFDGAPIAPSADAFRRIGFDGSSPGAATAPHALRATASDGSLTYALSGPYAGVFEACPAPGCALVALRGVRPR